METAPTIGSWYESDDGQTFVVTVFDEAGGAIEIMYADGGVDRLDLDTWSGLDLREIESPEDWSGSLD